MGAARYSWLIVATGLAAAPGIAAGQADEAIAGCSRIASAGDRILCLEDAIRRLAGEPAPAPPAARALETGATPPVTEASSPPAARDAGPASLPAPAEPAAETGDAAVAAAVRDEPAPPAAAGTVAATAAPAVNELGAEQVASRADTGPREPSERITATVVAFDFVRRDKLRVTLDNGQVWLQTDADRPDHSRSLRDLETFEVEMWQTGFGGYRMLIKATNKRVRVQRLK